VTESLPYDADEALHSLCNADPTLARLIERVGPLGLEVGRSENVFQALVRAIVYQQLSGHAAARIHGRLSVGLGGVTAVTPTALVAAAPETLRSAGLSQAKAAALRDLAAKVLDGTVPTDEEARVLGEDELVERLTRVRGVGRWSVEMLLIFHLGHSDVLPVGDLGIRKGYAAAFELVDLPTRDVLLAAGERWRPFRSVASWYLWRAAAQLPSKPRRADSRLQPAVE